MKNFLKILKTSIAILIYIGITAIPSYSVTDNECLECHIESDIEMEKNGRTISLQVSKTELKQSAHSKVSCIKCHSGFDPDDVPHKENIKSINCARCHKDFLEKHIFHPSMNKVENQNLKNDLMNCKGCHGTHNILSSKLANSKTNFMNSTEFCGTCHEDEKQKHLKSEHFVSLNEDDPNSPTCIYCHNYPITEGMLDDPLKLKINQEKLCLSCHLNNPEIETKYSKSLVNYENSVHGAQLLKGNLSAAVCVDCHGSHDLRKADSPESSINRFRIPDICGKCHISIAHEYETSIHGVSLLKGNKDVPGCTYCHGEHNIAPIPELPTHVFTESHINKSTFVENQMVYCIVCHVDNNLMKKYNLATVQRAHDWLPNQESHWETVRCVDCHSSYVPPNLSHNILPPDKTIKKCEECHSKNSILMTKLYKHESKLAREKFGFVNGTILSEAYVIGTTRNTLLDTLSIIFFSICLAFIGLHILLRWYFNRAGKVK